MPGITINVGVAALSVGLIVSGFAVLVIGFIILVARLAAKRRTQLQNWAEARGFTFDEGRDGGFDERFAQFKFLRQGSNRYAYNRCEGLWQGRPVSTFDYHYETYSRDSKGRRQTHHHRFSAVILRGPVPLQPLAIRPEHFFDRVAEFFGADDIDFESVEFSRRFHVSAPDRKWAYDVLHARAMQFLLDSPVFSIQFDHQDAIVWNGRLLNPADLDAALGVIEGLFDQMPEYLLRQQREPAGMT